MSRCGRHELPSYDCFRCGPPCRIGRSGSLAYSNLVVPTPSCNGTGHEDQAASSSLSEAMSIT